MSPAATAAGAAAALLARARRAVERVVDPEIPVLTIADLGILREVRAAPDGAVEVVLTPTYTGCPAMRLIEFEAGAALDRAGVAPHRIATSLSPPWTTDWLTEAGREKLRAYGVAPPERGAAAGRHALFAPAPATIACPRCGSREVERLSEFGSTACKALYRCRSCLEPFDYFKCA